ncbi:MAG: M48 family metalloprotease, partial [Leptospiraceae bacterium]|nr:M48 family metalloprotease [Leptospiraceae bacterium]
MKQLYTTILILFLGLQFTNCERTVNLIFSDKDDVKIGASIDKEIRRNKRKYRIFNGWKIRNYVQEITNTLLKSPAIKKKKVYPYRVNILDDDKTINAFCTPGGFIYVYTGLLKILPNEASLAAVLAHEIAHAEKRHARQRMLSSIGISLILSIILQDTSSVLVEMGTRFAGNLALLTNSRFDEMESDKMAFLYLKDSPYYPGAMSFFFDIVRDKKNRGGVVGKAIQGMLSTHPLPDKRLRENAKRIKKAGLKEPEENQLFSKRYQRMLKQYLLH